jgi:type I restriction enzyme R subunit
MIRYNPVVVSDESTVVAEFVTEENTDSAYQSEADLEREFIENLQSQAYEYLPITSEAQLIANLRTQLEALNSITFSDAEWGRFFTESIAKSNDGHLEKTIRIQEDYVQVLKRDDGSTKNVALIDKTNIHNNRLQVINQYAIAQGEGGAARSNRYDVTVLVNGLPLVHIELKRRGISIREAFNQIDRYHRDSFWAGSGLFDYVQVFVISNGTETKYYSNTVRRQRVEEGRPKSKKQTSSSFEFTSWWADAKNKPIFDLVWFTRTFFARHTLLNILTRYCVLTADTPVIGRQLLVMRPYQIVATERILKRIEISTNYHQLGTVDAGGYVWHTTGSGKTLTSFKTAQLATKLDYIDKVLFVVDRKDLDYQTMQEYDRFKEGAADSNTSTRVLKRQLEDPSCKIIITTIQKLSRFISLNRGHDIYGRHVVIVFDECHRSQFGNMHMMVAKSFKNYHMFGFTGTPIFAENRQSKSKYIHFQTTEQAFGEQLHSYTIVDAINDRNVLKFVTEYWSTFKAKETEPDGKKVKNINRQRTMLDHRRIEPIVDYILESFSRKTMQRRFNALFATSSIEAAKRYYEVFKAKQSDLPESERIRIGIIYSYTPNEGDDSDLGLNDEGFDTEKLDQSSRDFLDAALRDYNAIYNTTFDTSSDNFENYYKDLSRRIKDREIDLVIVVNMFLTGFDSKTLNTLYMDKEMRNHGLIQACSRTNRIYNSVKDKGNVIFFINLEKQLEEALALFGNKDASSGVLAFTTQTYEEHYREYSAKTQELIVRFPPGEPIIDEQKQSDFVKLFGSVLKERNFLLPSDEFAELGDTLTERQLQDYTSFYLDIRDDFVSKERTGQEAIDGDIVFELELVKQIEINVAYILKMVHRWIESHKNDIAPPSRASISEQIGHAVDASPSLRNKRDLIMEFVRSVSTGDDIDTEWQELIVRRQKEELEEIIAHENLKADETKKLITRALRDGAVPSTGTAITNIIQPTSRFSGGGELDEYKERVFNKLSAFVERFFRLSSGKDV